MEEKKTTTTEPTESTDTTQQPAEKLAETTPESATNTTDVTPATEATTTEQADPVTPAVPNETESDTVTTEATDTAAVSSTGGMKQYGIAFAIVVVFVIGLVYALEQQGRIDTNLFGWMQTDASSKPVAIVNGTEITGAAFAQNRDQVIMSAAQQGVDTTDPEVVSEIEGQALEVLINTQLLRQAAANAGITASAEEIDARYQEILESVGGEETLMTRMSELGITPDSLRGDIEGELLVQALIDAEVDTSSIEITEEEITSFYDGVAVDGAELPPLDEVRSEIEQQLRMTKEQSLVAEYIEELRAAAEIEILI